MLYVDSMMTTEEDLAKVKLFSCLVGESGRELLDTLMGATAKDAWTMDDILNTFDEHYNPGANETLERYRFFTKSQGVSETIDSYVTELKALARTCNFGALRDSLIRDRIVCGGSHNTGMRERLLRQKNMTLDTCVQLCRAAELPRENVKAIPGPKVGQWPTLHGAEVQALPGAEPPKENVKVKVEEVQEAELLRENVEVISLPVDEEVHAPQEAELPRENVKAISGPVVEEVHAVQGTELPRENVGAIPGPVAVEVHALQEAELPRENDNAISDRRWKRCKH